MSGGSAFADVPLKPMKNVSRVAKHANICQKDDDDGTGKGKETDTSISINRATSMLLANEKKADATTIRASSHRNFGIPKSRNSKFSSIESM